MSPVESRAAYQARQSAPPSAGQLICEPVEPDPHQLESVCVVCGTSFRYPRPARGRRRLLCSEQCKAARHAEHRADSAERRGRPVPRVYHRECAECGVPFSTTNATTQCCGRDCGAILGKRKGDAARSANSKARKTCQCLQCGATFVKARTNDPGRYCSRGCATAAARIYSTPEAKKTAERARARERRVVQPLPKKLKCEGCGKGFKPRSTKSRFCTEQCRADFKRGRDRSPRRCSECGTKFKPIYGDQRRAHCSPQCSLLGARRAGGAVRRLNFRAALFEKVNPIEVFQRDRYVCHICGKRTKRKERGGTHPLAPELDHIIPISRGGSHTYVNTACACRQCNLSKGNRIIGQLRLFG